MATTDAATQPLSDLTGFQRDLLAVIAGLDDPEPHGLGIKSEIEAQYGESEVNHGRLYPNLDELVNKGLVAKGELDARTNSYELTSRGERELRADVRWRSARLEG